jgi:transposase InsO family protein
VLDALNMALAMRRPKGVIHYSDQGSQYTSIEFGYRCREAGVRPSMGSVGDAYDNAMCESFFAKMRASRSALYLLPMAQSQCLVLNHKLVSAIARCGAAVKAFLRGAPKQYPLTEAERAPLVQIVEGFTRRPRPESS